VRTRALPVAAPLDSYDALPNPFIEAREFDVNTSTRLWAVPGSVRGGSLNKLLPRAGAEAAQSASAEVTLIDQRGQVHVRQILQTVNMLVITEQFALPRARLASDTDGRLADARPNQQMTKVVQRLIDVAGRLA
jgi:hypothetical protein